MSSVLVCRDIFSVKIYDNELGGWCHVFMSRARAEAESVYKFHAKPVLGIMPRVKLVHPDKRVVDMFLLAGNEIHGGPPASGRRKGA